MLCQGRRGWGFSVCVIEEMISGTETEVCIRNAKSGPLLNNPPHSLLSSVDHEVWLTSERRIALRMYNNADYGIWKSMDIYYP